MVREPDQYAAREDENIGHGDFEWEHSNLGEDLITHILEDQEQPSTSYDCREYNILVPAVDSDDDVMYHENDTGEHPGESSRILVLRAFLISPCLIPPSFAKKKVVDFCSSSWARAHLHEIVQIHDAHQLPWLLVTLDTLHFSPIGSVT